MPNELFAAQSLWLIIGAGILSVSLYLLLAVPQGDSAPVFKWTGYGLVAGSLSILFAAVVFVPGPSSEAVSGENWNLAEVVSFSVMAGTCVVSSVVVVVSRRMPSILLGFLMVMLGSAGLLMLAGAWFLAAANVFALAFGIGTVWYCSSRRMLQHILEEIKQPLHEPLLACVTAGLLIFIVCAATHFSLTAKPSGGEQRGIVSQVSTTRQSKRVMSNAAIQLRIESEQPHTLQLGTTLFREHFLSVEIVGLLMLTAAVGTALIVVSGGRESHQ